MVRLGLLMLTRTVPLKRTALKRKRETPRRILLPRCTYQRCNAIARDLGMCASHLRTEADRLFSADARERHGACYQCGTPNRLQWAHIFSRRYSAIRWAEDNYFILCSGCHTYFTHRPAEWEQFCRDHGVAWDQLRRRALTGSPMDPAAVIMQLKPPMEPETC